MDFILGADNKQQSKLTGWLGEMASYSAAPVRLGGAKFLI
jgi:hypothetical protein